MSEFAPVEPHGSGGWKATLTQRSVWIPAAVVAFLVVVTATVAAVSAAGGDGAEAAPSPTPSATPTLDVAPSTTPTPETSASPTPSPTPSVSASPEPSVSPEPLIDEGPGWPERGYVLPGESGLTVASGSQASFGGARGGASLSPDGYHVATTYWTEGGNAETIFGTVSGAAGATLDDAWLVTWSRDGSRVAMVHETGDGWSVLASDPSGHGAEELATFGDARPATLSWSRDSRSLLVSVARAGGSELKDYSIVKVDVASGATSDLGAGSGAMWSPTSETFAYFAAVGDGAALYVADADGSGARQVSANGGESSRWYDPYGPRWSPDGKWIAFAPSGGGAARVVASDGSIDQPFTPVGAFGQVAWAPDSTGVLAIENEAELLYVATPGRGVGELVSHPAANGFLLTAQFSPDSAHVVMQMRGGWFETDFWIFSRDGELLENVRVGMSLDDEVQWSSGGLTVVGATYGNDDGAFVMMWSAP